MDDLETLALILFTARHRSRRQAKRLLRDAGGAGTADELDALLRVIADHPQSAEIESHVQELAEAAFAAQIGLESPPNVGGNHPQWLVAEDSRTDRTFLLFLGHDCSFLAEVFDARDACRETAVVAKLDEQWLGNVLWLGEPPPAERQASLWLEARRELQIYDKRLGL